MLSRLFLSSLVALRGGSWDKNDKIIGYHCATRANHGICVLYIYKLKPRIGSHYKYSTVHTNIQPKYTVLVHYILY